MPWGRLLAEKLRVVDKQSVVIESKSGASGMVGASHLAKAAPDGYTLLLGSAGETAINPLVYPRMQYSPEKDLAPISLVTRVPSALVASPASPRPQRSSGNSSGRKPRNMPASCRAPAWRLNDRATRQGLSKSDMRSRLNSVLARCSRSASDAFSGRFFSSRSRMFRCCLQCSS